MNKALLSQALKFKNEAPTNSVISSLANAAKTYEKQHDVYFLKIQYRSKPEIIDLEEFFKFLSFANNITVTSFEQIEHILEETNSRQESIEKTGDSKSFYTQVFNSTVIFQASKATVPSLYQRLEEVPYNPNEPILAIENAESFLKANASMRKFGFKQFIYLGGFSNTKTREFLEDKNVVFFLDYDIEAIRIYNSFTCKTKSFFKHPKIEAYFLNESYINKELYKKQRDRLPDYHNEAQWLIELIKKHKGVIEQEVLN